MPDFGIYIHIPFCEKKCKYCDFISFEKCDETLKEKYINSIIKEIENCRLDKKITTIYIGGGTPSVLPVQYIQRILQRLNEKFDISKESEVTIEINPGTVTLEKLQIYKKIGINRLSIGLQSTHNRLLEMLGRIHKYEDFKNVYNDARKIGFNNINVDLMLGLPTQTLDEIEQSLKDVMNLQPEHISIYSLILEEGTELEKLISNKKLAMIPEDLERKMYWRTKKCLEKNGYQHYEISNFAQKRISVKT